ncbi:GNAT family N-acetyltransferase [Candidatus Saccharibacteria bacterium]|nr:GNAT family N-acetyltransferase [Candidatus Saccharibacteria bacterium]
MNDIIIRNLKADDDLARAGELLFLVDPLIFPDFLGDSERAKAFGPQLFSATPETALFSFSRTLVAEQNGELLGIMCYRETEVAPWDAEKITERFRSTGRPLPDNFLRANESYMKKITDAELPADSAEIEFLATAPEARGRGVASRLFEYMKNPDKYAELHLDVLANNENAIRLYEKQGFERVSTFPCYPDGSVNVYHMVLKLRK